MPNNSVAYYFCFPWIVQWTITNECRIATYDFLLVHRFVIMALKIKKPLIQ